MKQISEAEWEKIQRQLSKLACLEAGGVDNWEWYGDSLEPWFKENAYAELFDDFISDLNDVMVEAEVDEPAGRGCGYSITFDETLVKKFLNQACEQYLKIHKGED